MISLFYGTTCSARISNGNRNFNPNSKPERFRPAENKFEIENSVRNLFIQSLVDNIHAQDIFQNFLVSCIQVHFRLDEYYESTTSLKFPITIIT